MRFKVLDNSIDNLSQCVIRLKC